MLSRKTMCSIDETLRNPDVRNILRSCQYNEEIQQILEDAGIYVYFQDFVRVCAYIRILLSEH